MGIPLAEGLLVIVTGPPEPNDGEGNCDGLSASGANRKDRRILGCT